ncbi:hypothetical protein F7D13_00980 [Methylocystis rosea]|uniref:Lipoprotein n=1 Tax=Methylocystis rosea TaxID=173366 RepID=A0ABX6ECP3_9HYPH|nr:hypothetical protein [Methylocystis rosea]QGM92713.1 hypothetical protein F7D13_00980 [Methylocystis rosea]
MRALLRNVDETDATPSSDPCSLFALSLAACATQPPPPPDYPPPPMRKLDAKTQLETGRTY